MRKSYTLSLLLVVCSLGMIPATAQIVPATLQDDLQLFSAANYQDMSWRHVGPFRGGRTNAVTGVRGNDLIYYMGTVGGGIWKTTDAGQSWFNISDGYFSTASVGAIEIAPSDQNVIYAGTGEHAVRGVMSTHGDGMYKSTNGGQSWMHIGLAGTRHIAGIAVHPTDPNTLLIAAQGAVFGPSDERGIYLSMDGGDTWEQTLYINETTGAADVVIDPSNPRIIYATMWDHARTPWNIRSGGPGSGIFKSEDGGRNWIKLTNGLPKKMGKVGITVSPVNPQVLYANIEAEQGGVFRSNDSGRTWIQTNNQRMTWARAWYYMEVVADPVDEQTVYVLNAPLLKSIDGGQTFEAIPTPHTDHHDLWINPANPENLIVANDGGAAITHNGGRTWSSQYNQPTAQLYRVIADRRFPYHIYAGQQDYSTIAVPSRSKGFGITPDQTFEVGGGESAFITFDPENPRLIYGSSYQGSLTVFDHITKETKNIAAYPTVGIASTPRKNMYRFNWNAPVVANSVQSSIIYHAANKVLETTDGGYNWREISPDLTRNEREKQGLGGGPFINEGAGGEVYNTISYMASSPHDKFTLWAGSDDGLVHQTEDAGETWTDVTPPELGEAIINCIEISPHDTQTVYVVATRHKFNDLQPYVFRTNDKGNTWVPITSGIAGKDYVRVVREDPEVGGLLYAGTQNGIYISFNYGESWSRFQLNLPITPITDLTIADNDLVASTAGRGFWILDDLAPIQQTEGFPSQDALVLVQPDAGVRYQSEETPEDLLEIGENPLPGIIIDYFLPPGLDTSLVELKIFSDNQRSEQALRSYTNRVPDVEEYEGGPLPELPLSARAGHNRFNWDIRREPLPGIDGVYIMGDYRGSMVAPGDYRLELRTPQDTVAQTIVLKADPRVNVSENSYVEQEQLLEFIESNIRTINQSLQQMRDIRRQIETLLRFLKDNDEYQDLIQSGQNAISKIDTWEQQLIQTEHETDQDVINFEHKLAAEFMSLKETVDSADPRITSGMQARFNDLSEAWNGAKNEMDQIMSQEVKQFNRIFKQRDLPALILPKVESFD